MSYLWEHPDDGLAFEDLLKLEDDREPITAATPAATYPCGSPWPQKSAEQKVVDLSQRLAREQQTVQRMVRLNDDLRRSAEKWQVRCYRGAFWPFACGVMAPGIVWIFWQVAQ